MTATRSLLSARGLRKEFHGRQRLWGPADPPVQAVNGVDLDVFPGETLGLVGESGSGKSTLGRLLIRLIEPDAGSLSFDGTNLLELKPAALRKRRREFQIIFQDPYGSLNPRMRAGTSVAEPLEIHRLVNGKAERQARVAELFRQVGLDPDSARKYPHEFSGGQRQRIGIARAIACEPRFVVADEPVSALDPPVQAQIVNLLADLKDQLGLAYLFIAHDLSLVRQICDRVAVMYLGRIVEQATVAELFANPKHPYTQALLASTPKPEPGSVTPSALSGEPPSPTHPPAGCTFHPRCPIAEPRCSQSTPRLEPAMGQHQVACHLIGADSPEARGSAKSKGNSPASRA